MPIIEVNNKKFIPFLTAAQIDEQINVLAAELNRDYEGKRPLFIAILNGSFMFAADLMKKVNVESEISFMKLASYEGTSSTGSVKQLIGINEEIKGRTIVIIEDIVDTGNTIDTILAQLKEMGAAEVKIATLLFKPEAYTKTIPIEYVAIVVPNDFLVGYGLDYNGLGRNLADIYVLDYTADVVKA